MKKIGSVQIIITLLAFVILTGCSKHGGKVVDAQSNQPLVNAIVVHNGVATRSDSQGKFLLKKFDATKPVLVKMPGYRRGSATADRFTDCTVRMEPFEAKGVYLSFGALKTDSAREAVVAMLDGKNLNTLVIDVKNERGWISLDCDAGAEFKLSRAAPPAIDDMAAFIKELHTKNIYVIGRIDTFRDDALGHDRPDLAITDTGSGKPWTDGSQIKWADPFRSEVLDYNTAVAVTAAQAGFDEIQFNDVIFPARKNQKASKDNIEANREAMRQEFLQKVSSALTPYGVFLSVELHGPTLFGPDRQRRKALLDTFLQKVDYVSPSVFPAEFGGMFPRLRNKAAVYPYIAVNTTVQRMGEEVGSAKKIRPWLQHFKSSLSKMEYTEKEVALEIQGAADAGTSGFLLWQGASRYTNTLEAIQLVAKGAAKPDLGKGTAKAETSSESSTAEPSSESTNADGATDSAKADVNTNKVGVANP